jgi:hypothetical protein
MRLLIPTIGTILMLTDDWTFTLREERRNQKFANQPLLDLDYASWVGGQHLPDPDNPGRSKWVPNKGKTQDITLPKGTKLKVARIYIRNGGKDMKSYDSVTFTCNPHLTAAKAQKLGVLKGRFWAKLLDVNSMDVAFDGATMPVPEYRGVAGG